MEISFQTLNKDVIWLNKELSGCVFKDKRLNKRFTGLTSQMWSNIGKSIPFACQDWANTKAAYRFFSNTKIKENDILEGHFQSTAERCAKTHGTILVLQDTTEFSYKRDDPGEIGLIKSIPRAKNLFGQPKKITTCGILMHSSLTITTEGLPLGLAAVKFWTRSNFKGTNALKKHINPTRIPIEEKESYRWVENLKQSTELLNSPDRCIHIGDRESDIYELYCAAKDLHTHFLVRTCVDRFAGEGEQTIACKMSAVKPFGTHTIDVEDKRRKKIKVNLLIKFATIKVLPPIGKRKRYPELLLSVIYAEEKRKPRNREKISWKLMTDLPIKTMKEAVEKINWYAMRWKIETFHKILKSGCKAEESKLRTAERLTKLIAVFCILSWRIFWMTMINRSLKKALPTSALTNVEINLLNTLDNKSNKKYLSDYILQIAKLGGYLGRVNDAPPGNTVIWRGLSRLTDIQLGFYLALKLVGN